MVPGLNPCPLLKNSADKIPSNFFLLGLVDNFVSCLHREAPCTSSACTLSWLALELRCLRLTWDAKLWCGCMCTRSLFECVVFEQGTAAGTVSLLHVCHPLQDAITRQARGTCGTTLFFFSEHTEQQWLSHITETADAWPSMAGAIPWESGQKHGIETLLVFQVIRFL